MEEMPPELLRKVVKAIGNIPTRNTGVIGYASPLRSEMSERMIEAISRTAIKSTLAHELHAALRRVCDSLATFIHESTNPCAEALSALHEAQRLP